MEDTIFVQIASYRDPECRNTVKDIYEKAQHPEKIFIGINWQYHEDDDFDAIYKNQPYSENVRVARFHCTQSKGVCWARAETQKLHQGEKYTLQLDSHMIFIKNWDTELLGMYKQLLKDGVEKPVISHYPPNYTLEGKFDGWQGKMAPYIRESEKIIYFKLTGYQIKQDNSALVPSACIAGGMIFADASCIEEIPYDPNIYFYGEEITLSTRFWTKGWDIFNPSKIVLWHLFKSEEKNGTKIDTRKIDTHWYDQPDEYERLNQRSIKRTRHFFGTEFSNEEDVTVDLDKYKLGTKRTLHQYELFAGVDFYQLERTQFASSGMVFANKEKTKTVKKQESKGFYELVKYDKSTVETVYDFLSKLNVKKVASLIPYAYDNFVNLYKKDIEYIGLDLFEENCKQNRYFYRHIKNVNHSWLNFFKEPLPSVDLLLTVDLFEKIDRYEISNILLSASKSGIKYVATTLSETNKKLDFLPSPCCKIPFENKRELIFWDIEELRIYFYYLTGKEDKLRKEIIPILRKKLDIVQQSMQGLEQDYKEMIYYIYTLRNSKEARKIYNKPEVQDKLLFDMSKGKNSINYIFNLRYFSNLAIINKDFPSIQKEDSDFVTSLICEYLRIYYKNI